MVDNLFFEHNWAFKPRLNADEHLLLPLMRLVFETMQTHLSALVEAVLSGSFCKVVLLSEGAGCSQTVFPGGCLWRCAACNNDDVWGALYC